MPYLKLRSKYALRRFTNNVPLIVSFGNYKPTWEVSEDGMDFLKKCDGVTFIDKESLSETEYEYFRRFSEMGFIREMSHPHPLKPGSEYKHFHHKRIAQANWVITLKCNLRCLHCLNLTGSGRENGTEFSIENAKIIIKRLSDYGVESVKIFGGEPTVHAHLFDIIELIYASEMEVSIIDTNGVLVNESFLDRLDAIGSHPTFSISFDGVGTHDWMRNRSGCELETLNAIKLCNDRGFSTSININVNKKTLPVLDETMHCLIDLGCKNFKVLRTSETIRWQETQANAGEQLTIPSEEFAAMIPSWVEGMIHEIRKGISVCYYDQFTISAKTTGKDLYTVLDDLPEKYSGWCSRAENGISIGCEGHVTPCLGMEPLLQMHGMLTDDINLLKNDLEDILYGDFYKNTFRITRKDIQESSESCGGCDKWDVCYGGKCRLNALTTPQSIARGIPISKKYLCEPDAVYCYFLKSGYLEKTAEILDRY